MSERIRPLFQILSQTQRLSPKDFGDWTRTYFQNKRRRLGPDYPSNSARVGTVVYCQSHPENNGWPIMSDLQQGDRILLIGETTLTDSMLETFLTTAIITTSNLDVSVFHAAQSDDEKKAMSERINLGITSRKHNLVVLPHLEEFVIDNLSYQLDRTRPQASSNNSPQETSSLVSESSPSGMVVYPDTHPLSQVWDSSHGLFSINNVTIIGTLDPTDQRYRDVLPPSSALLHFIAVQGTYISQILPDIESLRSRLLPQGLSEDMRSRLQQRNHLLLCHTELDIIKPY